MIDLHSHPSSDSLGTSDQDQKNINAETQGVFLKRNKEIHEYDSTNKKIDVVFIRTIEELEEYIDSKLPDK